MNTFSKTAILCLTSLFMFANTNAADAPKDAKANAQDKKMEKTSDAGTIIFRIESIKPIKDKSGDVKQCSYVVTAYNRLNNMVKEANLDFLWQDNITGQYIQRIEDSSKLSADEISEQLSSEEKDAKKDASVNAPKVAKQFKPITSPVKFFNIAPHSQKSFSETVDTDKCFLLFDNLDFKVKDCLLEGQSADDKKGCADKFQYISSKNPEYYVEFGDVPENIVQDQIEDEKNMEMEKINNTYNEIVSSLEKVDNTLKSMR
ncbi:MAG: hypothetical protein IKO06_03455 [Alphaproteobacteria bacterium]|nr:hypothetical protein [Alphaproteobacteria bacterium]